MRLKNCYYILLKLNKLIVDCYQLRHNSENGYKNTNFNNIPTFSNIMYRLLLLLAIPALASAYQTMSVYADVNKDRDFFLWTYPWLIDNLSGDIRVMYYLLGSGRHSVPQMCALEQLDDSAFLQADYLRCEAQGNTLGYTM